MILAAEGGGEEGGGVLVHTFVLGPGYEILLQLLIHRGIVTGIESLGFCREVNFQISNGGVTPFEM